MDSRELERLLAEGSNPDAVLARLGEASHHLELPVDIDRRLHELLDGGQSPREIVERLGAYLAKRAGRSGSGGSGCGASACGGGGTLREPSLYWLAGSIGI